MKHGSHIASRAVAAVLAILLLNEFAQSQITVTYSNLQAAYAVGSQYSSFADTSRTILNIGTASGTAQTWDFRNRVYSHQGNGISINPSSAPRIADFPTANTVLRGSTFSQGDTIVGDSYLRLTATGLEFMGIGDEFNVTKFSPPIPNVKFPCTYLTSWTYRSDTTWVVPGFIGILSEHTYTVDAFGTLRIPGGDYSALRLKQVSLSTSITPFGNSQSRAITYNFMSNGIASATVSVDSAQENLANVTPQYLVYSRSGATDIRPSATAMLPAEFALDQNYPNPFNPATNIQFRIVDRQLTVLKVYDMLGREVSTLVNGVKEPGTYSVQFDGNSVGSGVYICWLESGGLVLTRKMVLMR